MPKTQTSQLQESALNRSPMTANSKFSDPSEPSEAHLFIVKDDEGCREFPLGGEVYSIGRDKKANIRLCSLFVSRRHATLVRRQYEDGSYGYQIVDGDLEGQASANGILVNGRKIQVHDLKDKDEIVFGSGVSGKYLKQGDKKTGPLDPFDITLIDPSMVDEDLDE